MPAPSRLRSLAPALAPICIALGALLGCVPPVAVFEPPRFPLPSGLPPPGAPCTREGTQPADGVAAPPSPSASTSASIAAPPASASSAPSASATASAAAKPPLDPPPRGKPGGHLAPEVIQRVVRQNFGHFRLCFESTLRNSPNLQNRVSVHFVIDVDGTVKKPRDGGSDTPDTALRACVVEAFRALQFPPPEGGTVTVTYPVLFSPGD